MKVIKIGLATSGCFLLLTGCSSFDNTSWKTNQTVKPSTLPSAVVRFIDDAGKRIGDVHPKILSATTDMDDATNKPMYRLEITGDFNYKSYHATRLQMIVDVDGRAGAFTDPKYNNTFDQINLNIS